MDAVVLAGALNDGPLRSVSPAKYEAEIEIAGKPMVDYVVSALRQVPTIERIVLVGHESAVLDQVRNMVFQIVPPGDSLIDSLINGLNRLQSKEPVLVATSDIPLITREAVEDFLKRCEALEGDLFYSFVSKRDNDIKYPGVQRTYVQLSEGTFTGGNLALLSPPIVRDRSGMLKRAASLRKKPVQLCSMLGWRYLWKLVRGPLTIGEIEKRVSVALQFKAIGVVSPYPEVGIDVDKPSDFELANRVLLQRSFNSLAKSTCKKLKFFLHPGRNLRINMEFIS
jgi:GTP:adenosylcobinamide-phosphate guanylyltransferase